MELQGNCFITAMGIMPHTDVEEALELSLSLDIPFWPQLPRVSFYEDMYAQVSERFPGITVDAHNRDINFSLEKFYDDLEETLENWENEEYFRLSPRYSAVYHKFLQKDLTPYKYIRGQAIGPVSYGLKIVDENEVPMIYYEEVRQIIFEFVAKKLQTQYNEMNSVHPCPFVWVDEPGLEMVFMAFTGYTSERAFEDYRSFLEQGKIVGGFAHAAVLNLADKVVEAVKSGAVRRFVVMAGCDGRQKSRNYYTEFAKALPDDTIILTAGCAKYRYNKLDLGDIGGIPRVLDAGQCNDCYSLAVIALKLKEVFELEDINQLPITYNVAWYEQKAVIVLLALLYLGVKNIYLGPTFPAFLSENVVSVLVKNFGIAGISNVEDDLKVLG